MLGNIGPWQLLILLLIVLVLFGTKRIRNLGSDLGAALRGFRKGLNEEEPRLEADPPAEKSTQAEQESEKT